jgi:hypothetical protein
MAKSFTRDVATYACFADFPIVTPEPPLHRAQFALRRSTDRTML